MENLERLKLSPAETMAIRHRISKLIAFTGIQIKVTKVKGNTAIISVEQIYLKNGWILNRKELRDGTKEIFGAVKEFRIRYVPLVYQSALGYVTKAWIKSKMKEFGMRQVDVQRNLGIDKSTLSSILGDNKKTLTRFQKSAFYFYFLQFELNKNFRLHLKRIEKEIER